MSRLASGPHPEPAAVLPQERRLLIELSAGAAGSVVAGLSLWVAGRRSARRPVTAFGRQTAAWGLVDAAIAARGWRGLAQGLFLLWLDVRHARRFHRLVVPPALSSDRVAP